MHIRFALGAALLSLACAHGSRVGQEDRKGWREYRSTRFIVDTDAREAKAADLIAKLEQFRAMDLQALFGEQVEIPGHLRVLALDGWDDFRAIAGDEPAAYYTHGYFHEPTVVLPMVVLDNDPQTVAQGTEVWIEGSA